MSPETTSTGRRDFVQAVAEKVRRDISSMGPKEAPKPPQEPTISEGTIDLGEHSKKMNEHRDAVKAHDEKQREYDDAQAKREEAGREYKDQFEKARSDVERLEQERREMNPRDRDQAARYSEEVGAVAETTVKYLVGVQEGIVTFDHITDPEVRSFAERAVKNIAEKALKVADPNTALESYRLIQQLSSGDLDIEKLQEHYSAFRDTAGRSNRSAIADLSAALIGTFDQTEEEQLQTLLETDREKSEVLEDMRARFVSEIPDTTNEDAIAALLEMKAVAEQVVKQGRVSEATLTELQERMEKVLKLTHAEGGAAAKISLQDQFPDGTHPDGSDKDMSKVRDAASTFLSGIYTSGLAKDAFFAAEVYPIVAEIFEGKMSLETMGDVFDGFARKYGLDAEEQTRRLAQILIASAKEIPPEQYADFVGKNAPTTREAYEQKLNNVFDLGAITPRSHQLEQKYGKIMEVYTDIKDKKLLRAIFDADEYLETYLEERLEECKADAEKEIRKKLESKLAAGESLSEEAVSEELAKQNLMKDLSLNFKDDVALLFGKLFKTVDEEAPATYWSEAVQQGDMWTQTANLAATFTKSLERVRDLKFKEGSIVHELVWTRRGEEYRLGQHTNNASGGADEMVRYSSTYRRDIKLHDWHEYMLLVSKGVTAMEGIKRYVHDARATQYNPAPEGGHLGQLKQFADSHMSSLDFDSFYEMPDNSFMMESAQLWDAMSRIQLAESNWVIPSSGDIDHESGVPVSDKLTLQYMRKYEGELEEWRIRQAASLGAGHHFSGMSLSGLMAAWADGPQTLDGSNQYRSYGVRDAEAYAEINPMRHILWRFRSSGMNTSVMFTPIGRINTDGSIQWGEIMDTNENGKKVFSYEKLQEAEKRFTNATTKGKDRQDVGIIRVIDIMNPGKLGDALYRGGWRDVASLDHWYVDRSNPEAGERRLSTIEKFKANEHVGAEYVKKFLGGIAESDLFTASGEVPEKDGVACVRREHLNGSKEIEGRRALVDYIAERYFRDEYDLKEGKTGPGGKKQSWDEYVQTMFDTLEKGDEEDQARWDENKRQNKGKPVKAPEKDTAKQLKARYKAWGMQASSRAMMLQDPTLFLTVERNNEVHGRSRAWDQVKQLTLQSYTDEYERISSTYKTRENDINASSKSSSEKKELIKEAKKTRSEELQRICSNDQYRQAVEDLAAVSAGVLRECRDEKWNQLDAGGVWVDQIELNKDDFVDEEKIRTHMQQMQEKGVLGSDEEAAARIDRVMRVFHANRQFSYSEQSVTGSQIVNEAGVKSSFIDAMGFKLGLDWPVGFHRAIAGGSVDFRALALREAGSRMPARVLGDASALGQGVAKKLEAYVGKLVEIAGLEDRAEGNAELAKIMHEAKGTMNGIHGAKDAYEVTTAMMTPMAVRMFRADSDPRHMVRAGYGRLRESLGDVGNKYVGKYRSLSEAIKGASNWHGARVDKPEDTRVMLETFADPKLGLIPQSQYDSAVQAKYEYDEFNEKVRRVATFDELTLNEVAEKAKARRKDVLMKWAKLAPLYLAAGGTFVILGTLIRGLKKELSADRR